MKNLDPGPTVEAPDDDPYIWLEERESPKALAWVEEQNLATMRRFADRHFETDRDTLKRIFDQPDRIPVPNRRGGTKLFNPWQDAEHPRGLWRVTTLESFKSEAPVWNVIVDLDALAVEPQQVVPGQTESADGCLRFYTAMRAMPVVSVQPDRKLIGAVV
jgi:prolyl oligopeptidase